MDDLFDGTSEFVASYIDDIGVYSETWEEHLTHLEGAFSRIKEAGLTLKPDKCSIGKNSCKFLGHNIGSGTIRPLEAKVTAVREFVRPVTKSDMRAFLGLTGYYRRFIRNYAARTVSLTDALGGAKPDKLGWTEAMENEFEDLKSALSGGTVLRAPDFSQTFVLQTDASGRGIGAVLAQTVDGEDRPVAYFSRKLNKAQSHYTATEKECLAVVKSIEHFAVYLLGKLFELQTDHKALLKLQTMQNGNHRLMRWSLALQPYQFSQTSAGN